MRIRSFYLSEHFTLSLARRAIAPLSTLAHRGENVGYNLILYPGAMTTRDDTVTILPDWSTTHPLPSHEGLLVYDLSDASLLDEDGVRAVIGQCQLTLVPNEATAALARAFSTRVVVAPSMVYSDWLLSQRVVTPDQPVVLLVGKEPSCLKLVPVLQSYLKKHPNIRLVTDHESVATGLKSLKPGQVLLAEYEPVQYPIFLRSAFLTLFAGEELTLDSIPVYEAAFMRTAAIAGAGFADAADATHIATSPQRWESLLTRLTDDDRYRAQSVNEHHEAAKRSTAVRNVDAWRQVLERAWRNRVRNSVTV